MTALAFQRALEAANVPVVGVSIGDPDDRDTWRINYAKQVTDQQRADGEAVRKSFDPSSKDAKDAERAAMAARIDDNLATQAMLALGAEERQKLQAGEKPLSLDECKARVRAIYIGLLP